MTNERQWAADWLFKRTIGDVDELMNLVGSAGEDEQGVYRGLQQTRSLLVLAGRRFGADLAVKAAPKSAQVFSLVCSGCGLTSEQEPTVRYRAMAGSGPFCNDCATQGPLRKLAVAQTTAIEKAAKSLGYRTGQTVEITPPALVVTDINQEAKTITLNSDCQKSALDFTGKWITRAGKIARVEERIDGMWFGLIETAGRRVFWDDLGHAENCDNDLIERIRDGAYAKCLF